MAMPAWASNPGAFCFLTPAPQLRYPVPPPMKKPPSAMSMILWVTGGLLAAYVIGGVILSLDLAQGGGIVYRLPTPFVDFILTIYAPVFILLWSIWPDLFPFLQ